MSEARSHDLSVDTGSLKRQTVHGAAATFVGQGARFVLQFASQIMLARLLLPVEFGLVAMVAPVMMLIAIFTDLGLSQATVQRAHITSGQLSALFWTNVVISTSLALLLALSSPLLARFYGEPRLTPITVALSSLLVLSGLAAQQVALLNREMRFVRLAVMDTASTAAAVVVGVSAAWAGLGVWSLVAMQAANMLTILIVAWSGATWRPSWPRREPGLLALLTFGGHLTGYNLVNFLGSNLDSVLIGKFSGSVSLGLYDRAFKLVAAPLWTISLPVARIAVSVLSRLQGAPERYRHAFLRMLQVLLLVTAPAVAFVAGAAPTMVPALMGPAWIAAVPIVTWLAIATGFAPLSISAYWLFVSQDRAGEQAIYACVRTVGTILALLAGLPWGAKGVAISYATTSLFINGLPLWGAARRGPVTVRQVVSAFAPLLVAAVAAFGAVLLVESRVVAAPLLRLGLDAAASYGAALAVLACLPGGRTLLAGLWDLRSLLSPRARKAQVDIPPEADPARG